jgi:hypothetical protein
MSGGDLDPAQPVVGRAVEQPERGLRGPQAPTDRGQRSPGYVGGRTRPARLPNGAQPASRQAPHHVLICPDGVLGVAVGPQRQLPGDGDCGEVGMTHADYMGDMQRYASSPRRHHRCVRAAQEICELAGVGNRVITEAVVYARSSAVLSWGNAGQRRAFGEIIRTTSGGQRRGAEGVLDLSPRRA